MEVLADLRQVAHGFDQAHWHMPRMRAREPDALDAGHLVHSLQQRREIARRIVRRLIVVDDLPEQLDLAVPLVRGMSHFVEDVALRAHALVPARVRHDAERAELVAAFDDGDVRLDRIVAPRHAERKRHVLVRVDVDARRRLLVASAAIACPTSAGNCFRLCVPTMTSIRFERFDIAPPSCCATQPVTATTGMRPVSLLAWRISPRRV